MNVLFMCVANSGRSQIAEAIAKKLFDENVRVESAGSQPKEINPLTILALQEIGIDASKQKSKSIDEISPHFRENIDYVITLCQEEVCPVLTSTHAKKLSWALPDPAAATGSQEEQLRVFRDIRNQIQIRVEQFVRDTEAERKAALEASGLLETVEA